MTFQQEDLSWSCLVLRGDGKRQVISWEEIYRGQYGKYDCKAEQRNGYNLKNELHRMPPPCFSSHFFMTVTGWVRREFKVIVDQCQNKSNRDRAQRARDVGLLRTKFPLLKDCGESRRGRAGCITWGLSPSGNCSGNWHAFECKLVTQVRTHSGWRPDYTNMKWQIHK